MTEWHHPAGTIGLIAGTVARYADVYVDLWTIRRPEGTRFRHAASSNIVANLNEVTNALHGDWLWVMGDDHAFGPDTLFKLLNRDVDIVVPLVLRREKPFAAPVFHDNGNGIMPQELTGGRRGLVEVEACGNAGMLIRRKVLDAMTAPIWEGGQIRSDLLMEDIYFCRKARQLGFRIWLDTEVGIGHLITATLWPKWQPDGSLGAQVIVGGSRAVEGGVETHAMEV